MFKMNQQSGVSLIEVLIALVVLAGGIVALIKFQAHLSQNRGIINQQSEAVQIAESKLEELRHFSVLTTTPGATAYDDISGGSTNVAGVSATYSLSWTVTDNTDPPHKVIVVTVSWTDPAGSAQSVMLTTIVAPADPSVSGRIMQGLP